MSLPTPIQPPPSQRWTWLIAGLLLLAVGILSWVNREGASGSSAGSRRKAAVEDSSALSEPTELRRFAEAVHLRYIESEGNGTPQEKLDRAIEASARSRRITQQEAKEALGKYAAMIETQPGRNTYETGLAALLRGDFAGAARAWPEGPEPTTTSGAPSDFLSGYLASADAHLSAGRIDDAVRACEDARRFLTRERDPENWARVQAALFMIRFNQGRMDEALPLAREVLDLRERCLPADSPGLGNALLNLGVCLASNHQGADAVPLYERALSIYQKAYGPGDVAVADAASELADALGESERLPEAELAARRAVSIYETAGEGQVGRLALALDRLGDILLSQQRPADAEAPLRRAMSIYDHMPSPRAKDHAGAQHRLGLALARAGKRSEALPHLKRSTVLAAKYFAPDDPALGTYYHNLAVWADAAGDDPATVEAYARALRIFALSRSRTGKVPPQSEQTAAFYAEYLRRSGAAEDDVQRRLKEAEAK